MAISREELTERDVGRAWEFYTKYVGADIGAASRQEKERMVGVYYDFIRGVPLSEVSDEQLYMIARRLHGNAKEIVEGNLTPQERMILKQIDLLKKTIRADNRRERRELEERICIELEDFPLTNPVSLLYEHSN
jgi:hypothetical protein